MERPLHFNFRDVLVSPGKALSAKKIFLMTFFLCLALAVYDLFTYLALLVDGQNLKYVFRAWGLLPFIPFVYESIIAKIIFILGVALAVVTAMLGEFAVAAVNIEQIRGNPFMTIGESIRFAFRRLGQMFFSQLTIVLFVGVIILAGLLLGLITRIPYAGEWLFALAFIIPNFVVAMLTVFIVMVLVISVILLPATAAADRRGEVFTAILETFSAIIRQPFRWLGYTAYSIVAAKVCGFVYAYFCFRAVQFITWTASLGGGDKPVRLVKAGLAHLPADAALVKSTFNVFPGINWSFSISQWDHGSGFGAAGHVMALMLFLVFASVVGYMLAIIATAQARGYVVIRYLKDEYNIAGEKPLFYEEEWVNPPVQEEAGAETTNDSGDAKNKNGEEDA